MNATVNHTPRGPETDGGTMQMVSDETTKVISEIVLYGLTPLIGIIGITGNTFSIIVLRKHGLHKCSNILLVSLAFMDTVYLTCYNNIPYLFYFLQGGGKFLYSKIVSEILYVLYFICLVADYTCCLGALCIPMLITIERLVAVYIPLKFGQIITPFRTWAAVIIILVFWLSCMIYTCFWYKFEYVFDHSLNRSVGLVSKSQLYYHDLSAIPIFEELLFSMKIPPLVTVIGCSAIIVKVKVASRERSKMTSSSSKQASTSRTTKTLLAVSFAYLFTCTMVALPGHLPEEFSSYSLTTENPNNVGIIIYQFVNILVMMNGSWNFLVYVVMNKNFRDTFNEIITQKCSHRR